MAFSAAMTAMRDICDDAVEKEPESTITEIEKNLCPNDCSGHGQCVNGTCTCDRGYGTEDCSVHLDQVPELLDVECGVLCDLRKSTCDKVAVKSRKLIPEVHERKYTFLSKNSYLIEVSSSENKR